MFVDASVLAAILLEEPKATILAQSLESHSSGALITNVIAVWEVVAALRAKKRGSLDIVQAKVTRFMHAAQIESLSITPRDLDHALSAFDRYGRHRYPNPRDRNKGLNLADCFHYATAKARRVPILTLDRGFASTDLEVLGFE